MYMDQILVVQGYLRPAAAAIVAIIIIYGGHYQYCLSFAL